MGDHRGRKGHDAYKVLFMGLLLSWICLKPQRGMSSRTNFIRQAIAEQRGLGRRRREEAAAEEENFHSFLRTLSAHISHLQKLPG